VYINSDISLDSTYKLQILIHNKNLDFYIPEFCVFGKFMHFLKVPSKMPIIKMFSKFYTILSGPKKNISLVFYCIYSCGS